MTWLPIGPALSAMLLLFCMLGWWPAQSALRAQDAGLGHLRVVEVYGAPDRAAADGRSSPESAKGAEELCSDATCDLPSIDLDVARLFAAADVCRWVPARRRSTYPEIELPPPIG